MSQPDPTTDPDALVDDASRAVDERDSLHPPSADRPPTPAEEAAAERNAPDEATQARVAEAYEDAAEHGATQQGEGRIV